MRVSRFSLPTSSIPGASSTLFLVFSTLSFYYSCCHVFLLFNITSLRSSKKQNSYSFFNHTET